MHFPFSKNVIAPIWLALLLASGVSCQVYAVEFGYVDAQRLVEQAPQGQHEIRKLETEFAERKQQLQDEFSQFKTQQVDFEKNNVAMTDEQRESKSRDLRAQQRKLIRAEREFNEDFRQRRDEELGKLEKVITEAIVTIAEREQLDVVLQQVVYASPKIDLTDQVLAELEKQHKK